MNKFYLKQFSTVGIFCSIQLVSEPTFPLPAILEAPSSTPGDDRNMRPKGFIERITGCVVLSSKSNDRVCYGPWFTG